MVETIVFRPNSNYLTSAQKDALLSTGMSGEQAYADSI